MKKELNDLASRLSDGIGEIADSPNTIDRIEYLNSLQNSLGISDDAAFLVGYIVGKAARSNERANVKGYFMRLVDLTYDINGGVK